MEQHLGHYSYYRNLRQYIDSDDRLAAGWVEVDYGRLLVELVRRLGGE